MGRLHHGSPVTQPAPAVRGIRLLHGWNGSQLQPAPIPSLVRSSVATQRPVLLYVTITVLFFRGADWASGHLDSRTCGSQADAVELTSDYLLLRPRIERTNDDKICALRSPA